MIDLDFGKAVAKLRSVPEEAQDRDWPWREAVVSSVFWLVDILLRRDQLVGAVHLLAYSVPSQVSDDERILFLRKIVLSCAEKSGTPELEFAAASTSFEDAFVAYQREGGLLTPPALQWLSVVRVSRSKSALELGCGSGGNVLLAAQCEPGVQWVGADPNQTQIDSCLELTRHLKFPGDPPSFYEWGSQALTKKKFDSVALLQVLEHTAYPKDILDQAEAMTALGGTITLSQPEGPAQSGGGPPVSPDMVSPHVNAYRLGDVVSLVKSRGRILDARILQNRGGQVSSILTYEPTGPMSQPASRHCEGRSL